MKIIIINRRTARQPKEQTFGERMAAKRRAQNTIMGKEASTAHRKAHAALEAEYADIASRLRALRRRKDPEAIKELEALLDRLNSLTRPERTKR